jgi:hypothetical protein
MNHRHLMLHIRHRKVILQQQVTLAQQVQMVWITLLNVPLMKNLMGGAKQLRINKSLLITLSGMTMMMMMTMDLWKIMIHR